MLPLLCFSNFENIGYIEILLSLLFGLSGFTYFYFSLKAFKFLPIGIVSSIISLEAIIVMILGYFFFLEKLSVYSYMGAIILLFSGVLLGLLKTKNEHLDSRWYLGVVFAFIGMLGGAFWGFGFSYLSRKIDIFTGIFLSEFSIFIFSILTILIFGGIRKEVILNKILFPKIFQSSIFPALATSMYFYSTIIGKVSISILFLSVIPLLLSIISHFLFNEKLKCFQWLFILMGFLGLILIYKK